MRVNVLSYEPAGGWILFDYAKRLAEHLQTYVEHVSVGFEQRPGFDVTFHVNYAGLRQVQVPGLHCTMVTHVDMPEKFALVRAQAQAGVWGLCMSEETARRMNTLTGVDRFRNFSPPAMVPAAHKRVALMLAGRLYEDGRKNEAWVIDFCRALRPRDVFLRVMGEGWEQRLSDLRTLGYEVEHSPRFNRELYLEWLARSDHLLYTGNDEGAISTLDAMAHGVVPIATAQGYHLEQEGEMLLFGTHAQLLALAGRIQRALDDCNAQRQRLTDWDGFARRHAEHWACLLADRQPQG